MDEVYENDTAPKTTAPSQHRKRTAPIVPILAVLVLLLGISLVVLTVLSFQKERTIQGPGGHTEKLCNVSYTPRNESERDILELLSSGWKFYKRSLYFFSQEEKSWQEAQNACAAHGANLTSVTSRKELEFLHQEANGTGFWIGLKARDQGQGRTWAWTDGTKYNNQASFWANGEPNNWEGKQEDCVQIRFHGINSWNDETCTHSFKWICKKVF